MRAAASTPVFAFLALSAFCSFLLLSTSVFVVCGFLARLAHSAAARFTIAAASLAGMTALWLRMLWAFVPTALMPPALPTGAGLVPASATTVLLAPVAVPILILAVPAGLALYTVLLLCLLAAGAMRRRQLARALQFRFLPPSPLLALFRQLAEEAGVPRATLWLLPGLQSPAAVGVRRAAVYLPAEYRELTPELPAILRHELAHISRRDPLWEALARAARALLFFHPLAHLAFRSLRFQRELACDVLVVRSSPNERGRYADTLLRFGRMGTGGGAIRSLGLRFAARPSTLGIRVRAILAGERFLSRAGQRWRVLGGAAALWAFAALAPNLSVSIGLRRPAPAPAPVIIVPQEELSPRKTHRAAVARAPRTHTAHASPSSAAGPALALPELAPASWPEVRYTSRREGTLGTASQDAEATEISESSAPASVKRPRSKAPTLTTTVLIGAAIELGRIGLHHIHDHDRD